MNIVKKQDAASHLSSLPTGLSVAMDTRMRQAQAETVVSYQMAFMLPRDWNDVQSKLLALCENPDFAKEAVYSKIIDGIDRRNLSIRFAEQAQALMRNIRVEVAPDIEDDTWVQFRMTVTDLESNAPQSETFRVTRVVERYTVGANDEVIREGTDNRGDKIFLVRANEEQLSAKRASIQARVKRGLILSLIPAETKVACLKRCLDVLSKQDAVDPGAALKGIIQSFLAIGVEVSDLKEYLGKPPQGATPAELQHLRELHLLMRDGETTWSEALSERQAMMRKNSTKAAFVEERQRAKDKAAKEKEKEKAKAGSGAGAADTAPAKRRGRKAADAPAPDATSTAPAAPPAQNEPEPIPEPRAPRPSLNDDDEDEDDDDSGPVSK